MCGFSPRHDLHMSCHERKKARGEVMSTVKREYQSRIGRTRSEIQQPLLLTIPEAAASLRLSRAKVYRLIYYEGLPVVHFGRAARVSVIALQEWLEERDKSA
jgi:excisionase family DNA binding protein